MLEVLVLVHEVCDAHILWLLDHEKKPNQGVEACLWFAMLQWCFDRKSHAHVDVHQRLTSFGCSFGGYVHAISSLSPPDLYRYQYK